MTAPEHEVSFTSGGLRLTGSLRQPSDRCLAAVLLLPGSGPVDRDSDHRRLPLGITRLLAEALADAGVLSLRYDKRGTGGSEGDFLRAGLTDAVDDARAALAFLRRETSADELPIAVVGHSEGAFIASTFADDPSVDGLALLAGCARDGRATLAWQASVLQWDLPAPVRAMMRLLRTDLVTQNRKRVDRIMATTDDVGRSGGVKMNLRWYREFVDFDPAAHLARAQMPVLAITGARDLQAPPEDIEVMRAVVGDRFTGHVVDDVNHILRTADTGSLRAYRGQTAAPLDDRVVLHLLGWLHTLICAGTRP